MFFWLKYYTFWCYYLRIIQKCLPFQTPFEVWIQETVWMISTWWVGWMVYSLKLCSLRGWWTSFLGFFSTFFFRWFLASKQQIRICTNCLTLLKIVIKIPPLSPFPTKLWPWPSQLNSRFISSAIANPGAVVAWIVVWSSDHCVVTPYFINETHHFKNIITRLQKMLKN